ncbi:MAG TPA: histidine phosphatase family protein [bacterium]|nr:histidine phosphatase family protein [bacterium]HPT29494.1 histidine phosphatase family protein [bacterium]
MLKIYLTRHGQDKDNEQGILNGHRDEPLSDLGISQAGDLVMGIKKIGLTFEKVYTSPLLRTRQTADIIARELKLAEPEVLEDLIERDFGTMTGQKIADIKTLCAGNLLSAGPINYFLSPEGAETFPQLIVRAQKMLAKIEAWHQDGNVLLVTHGDIGKMIYAAYYNLDWQETLLLFHFGNTDLILLSPDSTPAQAHVLEARQYNP